MVVERLEGAAVFSFGTELWSQVALNERCFVRATIFYPTAFVWSEQWLSKRLWHKAERIGWSGAVQRREENVGFAVNGNSWKFLATRSSVF